MFRKIAVAVLTLVPLFVLWSAARGAWDLDTLQQMASTNIPKATTWAPRESENTATRHS